MSRPKLLLADDSVTIRKVVELTFADEGIDVTAVGDAESAMQKFVDIQPDIVLVDVGLDGTSGYQICEMIKADDATRHIPVLLLVGSFEPFDQSEAERVGADGFLTKPFHSIRDLVARVRELLAPQAAAAAAGGAEQAAIDQFTADAFAEKVDGVDDGRPSPETEDIENLYRNSFANTVEIDEYDTVDDVLGDTALDDEMIEATFPTEAFKRDISSDIPDAYQPDTVEMSKEFDWSPESVVTEAAVPEAESKAFEPKFVFEDAIQEDDVPGPIEPMAVERIQDEPFLAGDTGSADAPIGEGEERPETDGDLHTQIVPGDGPSIETPAAEPAAIEQPLETLEEQPEPEVWPDVEGDQQDGGTAVHSALEITPDLVDKIAEKVMERLSDHVIREVALEAVPRIAEKLIREALETSGRKD